MDHLLQRLISDNEQDLAEARSWVRGNEECLSLLIDRLDHIDVNPLEEVINRLAMLTLGELVEEMERERDSA